MQIRALDLRFRGTPGLIASWLIESEQEKALIETGPASTLPQLLGALQREAGVSPGQIRRVFVTHAHLDHAGAAGWWARQGAQVYCHPRARRHLIDPRYLLGGAQMVYGDAMDELWGETLPAPEAQVTALEDGESVAVGAVTVTALDTPGHARHHHAYAIGAVCFPGDVAGMRLESSPYLSVTSAPSQFELQPYLDSIKKLRRMEFAALCLTHFGEVSAADSHLAAYAERVREVAERACQASALPDSDWRELHGREECELAKRLGVSEDFWEKHEKANPAGMCADGLRQWVQSLDRAG